MIFNKPLPKYFENSSHHKIYPGHTIWKLLVHWYLTDYPMKWTPIFQEKIRNIKNEIYY